jgi:hypothetical protein
MSGIIRRDGWRSIDRSTARWVMYLPEPLTAALQAERERETERRTKQWRLLHPDPVWPAEPTRIVGDGAIPADRPRFLRWRKTSSGSACEPA